jgi:hypothetical protein
MWAIIGLPLPPQYQQNNQVIPISVTNVINDNHMERKLHQSPFT